MKLVRRCLILENRLQNSQIVVMASTDPEAKTSEVADWATTMKMKQTGISGKASILSQGISCLL